MGAQVPVKKTIMVTKEVPTIENKQVARQVPSTKQVMQTVDEPYLKTVTVQEPGMKMSREHSLSTPPAKLARWSRYQPRSRYQFRNGLTTWRLLPSIRLSHTRCRFQPRR